MNTKTAAVEQMKALKNRLNAAIESRDSLEDNFSNQTNLLTQFISKLSHVSKGINLELDNRLAQLRIMLTKAAPISDVEEKIYEINKLLQQHSKTNEQNISTLHEQFIGAGTNLQKISGLPEDLRRKLRGLLNESLSTKDSLNHYIPLFSQLLDFYNFALKSKNTPKGGLLSSYQQIQAPNKNTNNEIGGVNQEIIEKLSTRLSDLQLSIQQSKKVRALNKKLIQGNSNDDLLHQCIDIFDVIIDDLKTERNSTKSFLTTLNDTLSAVQSAVRKTLTSSKESQESQNTITDKLQTQLLDMSSAVEQAISLDTIKVDISNKLKTIACTLEDKVNLEQENQKSLVEQLSIMVNKVNHLEKQSQVFEKKLAEQQRRSMRDALTRLSNRAAFDDYFSKSMVRYHHKPYDLALIVIDIDNFKYINDTYGHNAGDKTLQVIASTLQKTITNDAFVARYGGEEFVLIYNNIKKDRLVQELNALNKSIAQLPFKFKNNKVSITMSMGVTHIKSKDNIHIAFERADEAMYKAKAQGKNQVVYFQ